MRIMCVGDSITYGSGLSDLSQRWSDLTAARTGVLMENLGVSGDTTGGMLARCQYQVFPQKPDALILLGGPNEIFFTLEYLPSCANVVSIVRQAQAHGIKVLLGIPLPFVAEELPVQEWNMDKYNPLLATLCEQYANWLRLYCRQINVPVVDFREEFYTKDNLINKELFLDGIHPNAQGHQIMSDVLCARLKSLGWAQQPAKF